MYFDASVSVALLMSMRDFASDMMTYYVIVADSSIQVDDF
jgi:hypothetical protein